MSSAIEFNDKARGWHWLPTPPHRSEIDSNGTTLRVEAKSGRDWWRSAERDSQDGNAYVFEVPPKELLRDFECSVTVSGAYKNQFDQVTLFLLMESQDGANKWAKAGCEADDGKVWVGAVVTQQHSDWSIVTAPPTGQPLPEENSVKWIFRREADVLKIRMESDNSTIPEFRRDVNEFFNKMDSVKSLKLGIMACTPLPANPNIKCSFQNFRYKSL